MKKRRAGGSKEKRQKGPPEYLCAVVDIFVVLVLTGQMLVYDDFYFNIIETKYHYFCACVIGMLMLFALYGFFRFSEAIRKKAALWPPKAWLCGRKLREVFSSTDALVILFTVIVIISTALSPSPLEAFWGNKGRHTGAFFLLLCTAVYFCISRCYRVKWWHMEMFLMAGMIMCLFGITDYFGMDLLHFKAEIDNGQYTMFTSFIGNVNTYTACVAMVMGMAGVLFAVCKNPVGILWYGACVTVAFVAIITGQSDNAYLALGAFFGFLPLYLFRSRRGFRRYVILAALFVSSMQYVAWTQAAYAGTVVPLSGMFGALTGCAGLKKLTVYLWLAVACLYAAELAVYLWKRWGKAAASHRVSADVGTSHASGRDGGQKPAGVGTFHASGRDGGQKPADDGTASASSLYGSRKPVWYRCFVWGWWLLIAAAAVLIAYAVYDATIAGNGERYGVFRTYLEFNDKWGTSRGYIWRIAVEDYRKFPLAQKIFGYGPDTFGIVTLLNNKSEMYGMYNLLIDSAHNEYLQLFVTVGPLGCLAYLGIIATSIWHAAKQRLDNPYIVGAMFAVICYGLQAVVNINQTIATPVMWTLLCVCCAVPAMMPQQPSKDK